MGEALVLLNLGAGPKARHLDGWVNVDKDPRWEPDLLLDVCDGLPFPDDSVDRVLAKDFLEHIPQDKVIFVIEEIWRVLKQDGMFAISVPSTCGRGAFMDPTHKSAWNLNSWLYFSDNRYRELIGTKAKFLGVLKDVMTNPRLNIIHTEGTLYAKKH